MTDQALQVLPSTCFSEDSRIGGGWGNESFGFLPLGLLLGVVFHV